jgi:hypothetical protein
MSTTRAIVVVDDLDEHITVEEARDAVAEQIADAEVLLDKVEYERPDCSECNVYLTKQDDGQWVDDDGSADCPVSEDGTHDPSHELDEPPEDEPTRDIRIEFWATVPNDGYDYHTDVTGRLEQVSAFVLAHPLVSSVQTGGVSGSGYVEERETTPPQPHPLLSVG